MDQYIWRRITSGRIFTTQDQIAIRGFPAERQIKHCSSPACQKACKLLNEILPLERVTEAYGQMMSGNVRFRVVLKIAES